MGERVSRPARALFIGIALAAVACSRDRPAPAEKKVSSPLGPPAPAELCRQITLRFGDGGGGALKSTEIEAMRRCVAIETSEEQVGAPHWRCHSTCLAEALTEAALAECDTRCPLPDVKVDCAAAVRAADVTEAFGAPATLLPDSSVRDSFCGYGFRVKDETVVVTVAGYRSVRGLYVFTEGVMEPGVEAESAQGVGDRAVRFGKVLSATGDHECGVRFAQRRVGVSMTVRPTRPGCPFDRLEKLGKAVAPRLP